ncbi:MAG: DUF2062 domain-containing protein [Altibacter sp.]|uniref:DUF2062 domain-containing protein n=1 Tax=Altibacter sp. TaxID=2024823 RepID=UPI001D3A04F5|nr:DUF2062 domain-containing protein [Altibacter sp.]MBZ0328482.1 DUF2062 domain-containing protein [Altibacter sp.]
MKLNAINTRLKALQCCVIIPTYNNYKTLKRVIDGVLVFTKDIIIVNDGSTDSTAVILKDYPQLQQITLPKNKGKGNALRLGFKQAEKLGFQYAITIDSDGQHFPEDIQVFVEALENEENKNVLLIGARNMSQEGVPKKSSFGNKFSNFWYWVETGIRLQDTQSGFRLYPIGHLKHLKFYTKKFEFEIEVIVRAAWQGTLVKNVPIKVSYDESERVSHFRPFKDFTRISILNTCLVILTFIYILPRDIIKKLKKKGFKRFIMEDFLGNKDAPKKKALSIALGVFIGLTPFWGFHTIIVIFLAILFKLNKAIAFTFSNVSLPPFIPFVLYASSKMGQFVLGETYSYTMEEMTQNFEVMKHLKTYIVGSFSLAILSSIVLGLLGYLILMLFNGKQKIVVNE